MTRILHIQLAPNYPGLAANFPSDVDVASATSPSAQKFSLKLEQSVINLKIQDSCLNERNR